MKCGGDCFLKIRSSFVERGERDRKSIEVKGKYRLFTLRSTIASSKSDRVSSRREKEKEYSDRKMYTFLENV